MEKHCELKEAARIGAGMNDDKEARVLNRIVSWTDNGLVCETGPRHYDNLVDELGLDVAKSVSTPCVKHTLEEINKKQVSHPLGVTHVLGLAARANHSSADRADRTYSAREVRRLMAAPTDFGTQDLKRLAGYLLVRFRMICICIQVARPCGA